MPTLRSAPRVKPGRPQSCQAVVGMKSKCGNCGRLAEPIKAHRDDAQILGISTAHPVFGLGGSLFENSSTSTFEYFSGGALLAASGSPNPGAVRKGAGLLQDAVGQTIFELSGRSLAVLAKLMKKEAERPEVDTSDCE